MSEIKQNKDDSIKYRIGVVLFLLLCIFHFNNSLKIKELLTYLGAGIVIGILIAVVLVKLNLTRKKYVQGIGCIAFAVSIVMWKKISAYSITLEAVIAFSMATAGLILSFKYSSAELEGKLE